MTDKISVTIDPAQLYKQLCPVCQKMLEQLIADQLKDKITEILLDSKVKEALEKILRG